MKIKWLGQVNSHWTDGRHFSAMEGGETVVDDGDKDLVAHMKYLVKAGLGEVVKDEPAPKEAPAEPKKTTTAAKRSAGAE
jgi:hypothetical protein